MPDNRKRFRSTRSLGDIDKRRVHLDETFDSIMEDLANTLQTLTKDLAKNLTFCEFPIGSTIRQFGSFVYGYSISMDTKGNTSIQEFGNVKLFKEQQDEAEQFGIYAPEQLVDVINEPTPSSPRLSSDLASVAASPADLSAFDAPTSNGLNGAH